ncbi:hypothetical protein ACTXT7_007406 [Hymenolepis weldensis]
MGGYTPDRSISLTSPDWIDELNLIQFSDENEAYQTPTLEHTNAENLVRGCNQCLQVAEIPHSSILARSLNPDFLIFNSNLPSLDPLKVRHTSDRFTFGRVRFYSTLADNRQIRHVSHQQNRGYEPSTRLSLVVHMLLYCPLIVFVLYLSRPLESSLWLEHCDNRQAVNIHSVESEKDTWPSHTRTARDPPM